MDSFNSRLQLKQVLFYSPVITSALSVESCFVIVITVSKLMPSSGRVSYDCFHGEMAEVVNYFDTTKTSQRHCQLQKQQIKNAVNGAERFSQRGWRPHLNDFAIVR